MDNFEVKLRTLTPLWTGGVQGEVDRIHETGILGSLRWWYEVLVRGFGREACDPSEGQCRFDADRYRKPSASDERQSLRDAGLCDVCQVFGATGWRRRFRLLIEDDNVSNAPIQHTIRAERSYTNSRGKQRTPTWYFRDPTQSQPSSNTPKVGECTLKIQGLSPDFSPNVIAGLIQFIADWTAIGAKAQMGFGVIEAVDARIDTRPLYDWLAPVVGSYRDTDLPSLQNLFLARIQVENATDQNTFNLKYDLRQLFAHDENWRHFTMGTVKGPRMAAKVKVSRPYDNNTLMRVWGWIPQENAFAGNWNREAVVASIHNHVKTNYNLQVWREMNSPRDAQTPNTGDAQAFLRSLLCLEEEENAA